MLYSRGRHTEDSISDMLWALQMDYNAHRADEYASNVHVDNEQFVRGHSGQRSSSIFRLHVNIQYNGGRIFQTIREGVRMLA